MIVIVVAVVRWGCGACRMEARQERPSTTARRKSPLIRIGRCHGSPVRRRPRAGRGWTSEGPQSSGEGAGWSPQQNQSIGVAEDVRLCRLRCGAAHRSHCSMDPGSTQIRPGRDHETTPKRPRVDPETCGLSVVICCLCVFVC